MISGQQSIGSQADSEQRRTAGADAEDPFVLRAGGCRGIASEVRNRSASEDRGVKSRPYDPKMPSVISEPAAVTRRIPEESPIGELRVARGVDG